MSSRNGFKVLRVKTPLANPGDDDPDYAGLQTTVPADEKIFLPEVQPDAVADTDGVAIIVEWLDAGDAIVAGRGSFDLTYIQVVDRVKNDSFDVGGKATGDSVQVNGLVGYKVITIDEIRGGDELALRFTNITPPGGATKLRVLYREL